MTALLNLPILSRMTLQLRLMLLLMLQTQLTLSVDSEAYAADPVFVNDDHTK